MSAYRASGTQPALSHVGLDREKSVRFHACRLTHRPCGKGVTTVSIPTAHATQLYYGQNAGGEPYAATVP